jgi:6-phosphogluconolactonase
MKLNVFDTPDEVINAIADYFVDLAKRSIVHHGNFSVALSGGSSPKKLYELLASDDYKDQVEWDKVHFFWGDERNVPHDSPYSNYLMVKKVLFDPLNISDKEIYPVNTSLLPAEAAKAYANDIEKYFGLVDICFDLELLGLGDNSHTASLFPHTPILHDDSVSVKEVWLEDQQVYRISMTAPMINKAHNIAFLVYGEGKAEAVHHVIEGKLNIEEYPAQLIKPVHGDLQWFLDKAAASKLKGVL